MHCFQVTMTTVLETPIPPQHLIVDGDFGCHPSPSHVIYFVDERHVCDTLLFNQNYEVIHSKRTVCPLTSGTGVKRDDGIAWWTGGHLLIDPHLNSLTDHSDEVAVHQNGVKPPEELCVPCSTLLHPRCHYLGQHAVNVASLVSFNCRHSARFCRGFLNWARRFHKRSQPGECSDPTRCQRVREAVGISMTWDFMQQIDHRWCERICGLVTKRMLLDDAMSWLNTLGGGYSALGDYYHHHAETAGQISMRQMKIALEMGDPPTVIRCHLYFAISLMQRGYTRAAKYIIRSQYRASKALPSEDVRLLASCQGIWARLRYLYLNKGRTAPR